MTARCAAYAHGAYPSAHTCDDPVACALSTNASDPRDVELEELCHVVDQVRDLIDELPRSKLASEIRKVLS